MASAGYYDMMKWETQKANMAQVEPKISELKFFSMWKSAKWLHAKF